MFFTQAELDAVRAFYQWAGDAPPTPLRHLPALAGELGVAELLVKDESCRFGLPAFKIVGTRYAVADLVASTSAGTLACATAGNHGRAVARAARETGRHAQVYVPAGTAPARLEGLRSEGATVTETGAGYDDAVRQMARDADAAGWTIVSDAGWEGYETIPRRIMAGYTWILDEAAAAWGPRRPDLVVVQGGVGSFAGAVAAWLDLTYAGDRPRVVVVEPHGAACIAASLAAGRRVTIARPEPTSMAGLRCGEVSLTAWPALAGRVDATVTISDAEAADAIARLAEPAPNDPAVAAGPSGAAGLAGFVALMRRPTYAATRTALGLSPASRVLVFNTEGPVDR